MDWDPALLTSLDQLHELPPMFPGKVFTYFRKKNFFSLFFFKYLPWCSLFPLFEWFQILRGSSLLYKRGLVSGGGEVRLEKTCGLTALFTYLFIAKFCLSLSGSSSMITTMRK